jgi:hypothetical protein
MDYNIVTKTDSLNDQQQNYIKNAIDHQWNVSEFKSKHFVGKSQITPYGELKQYLIELSSREGIVENLEYELEKLIIKKEIEEEHAQATQGAQQKLHILEIKKYERLIKGKENQVDSAYKERDMFVKLIDEFNHSERGKEADGSLVYDHIFDDDYVENKEKEYWTVRLAKQTAMDMIAYGRAGAGNMDSVMMLPPQQQQDIMELASTVFIKNENRMNQLISHVNETLQLEGENSKHASLIHQIENQGV